MGASTEKQRGAVAVSFLKVGDVAAELSVSEQAVRLWCRTGLLPARRPSGTRQWLIDRDDLEQWLNAEPVREAVSFVRFAQERGRPDHLVEVSTGGGEPQRR